VDQETANDDPARTGSRAAEFWCRRAMMREVSGDRLRLSSERHRVQWEIRCRSTVRAMHPKRSPLAIARRLLAAAILVIVVGTVLAMITQALPEGARAASAKFLPLLVPVAALLELTSGGFAVAALVRARGTAQMSVLRRPATTVAVVDALLVALTPVEVFSAILLASLVASRTT